MAHSPPFLISASRRTDIPAFYGEWFRRRLREGWCEVANPFSGKLYRVSLAPEDVLGWIFWSRDYAPFLDTLSDLYASGQRFLCQFTITGCPDFLEPRTPSAERATETAARMASLFGPDVVQWRYDPIILSSATPPEWHVENFTALAGKLKGSARRCYFSFPTMYRKTVRNLEKASAFASTSASTSAKAMVEKKVSSLVETPADISPDKPADGPPEESADAPLRIWSREKGDFTDDDLAALAARLAAVAAAAGMEMRSCCGEKWVNPEAGILGASCVDWPLLQENLAGIKNTKVPLHPSRKQCGCHKSVDIGRYHTCAHGCAYCYAVENPESAQKNLQAHAPDSARL